MTPTNAEIPGVEGELPPEVPGNLEILRNRRWIGYALGVLALVSIIGALKYALLGVMNLKPPTGDIRFEYVRLAMHVAVVIAWVFFSYQLLRAAERLIIPYWWLRENLDAVRVVLGITDPWRAALKASGEVLEMSGKTAQQVVEVVESVSAAARGKKPE